MTPEQFIQNHFPGLEKETWYPTIVAIAEGYSKALTAEVERLREALEKITAIYNDCFPKHTDDAIAEINDIATQTLSGDRKEVGNV